MARKTVPYGTVVSALTRNGVSRSPRWNSEIPETNIDYAKMVAGMGIHSQGPFTDPKDLGPAIKRAIEVVKLGEPSLIDVVTQPR